MENCTEAMMEELHGGHDGELHGGHDGDGHQM